MKISDIAGVAHEINRALCQFHGDDSQLPWADASAWQVESACHGVSALLTVPHLTSAQQHELWMQHKLDNGWRYGPLKDEVEKTHPCLVPYDQLPEHQRLKDILFQATVRALIPMMVLGKQETYTAQQVQDAIDEEELSGECTPEVYNWAATSMETLMGFAAQVVESTKGSIAKRLGLTAACTCEDPECAGFMSTTCGYVQTQLALVESLETEETPDVEAQ